VNFRENDELATGPLLGYWRSCGNVRAYSIGWPVVDIVDVSSGGESLEGKSRFGEFTAKRDPSCKGP
jgi:hypothetical protein